ncbi:hypothetical protein PMIN01_13358 [Paraphaeosphaeria minitans]|uniref:Uncharacterized protein n=1 Tax=Paraphaeosphaeria minitans TaxID=565426 RepID=A0A9P6KJ86_9PLEO|nr:hypothetical protein PMIN01_13358 [Paraphaeosphaeria minitans]
MNAALHYHRWSLLASSAFLLTASVLCLLCVLSGVCPGWLSDYHTVRITAFHDALKHILASGENWRPRISLYAANYCSQIRTADGAVTRECSSHRSSDFDVTAGLRIALIVSYALGIASSVASLAFSLHWGLRENDRSRHRAKACTWIASGAVGFASISTTVLAYAVYMLFAKNLAQAVLSVEIGAKFFALTWTACICLALALAIMWSWKATYAQRLR